MIRKFLFAGAVLAAIAAFTVTSQPVEAGMCTVVSAKARGVNTANVTDRSMKKFNRRVNRLAKKKGLSAVRVGTVSTNCGKKVAIAVCTSAGRVCS